MKLAADLSLLGLGAPFGVVSDPAAELLAAAMSHWSMEESSGTRVDDVGVQNLTANGTLGSATGKVGNGADFSADATAYFNFAYNASATPGITGNGATWAAWFRRSAIPSSGSAGICGEDTATNPAIGFRINSTTGRVSVFMRDGNSTVLSCSPSSGNWCDNAWHLAVATYNSTDKKLRLYVDNTLLVTSTGTGTSVNVKNSSVGYRWGFDRASGAFGRDSPTTAILDQCCTWDYALDADEISTLWNAGAGIAWSA